MQYLMTRRSKTLAGSKGSKTLAGILLLLIYIFLNFVLGKTKAKDCFTSSMMLKILSAQFCSPPQSSLLYSEDPQSLCLFLEVLDCPCCHSVFLHSVILFLEK